MPIDGHPVLAVIIDWPYSNIPWIYMASLWQSDVRMEKHVFLVRTSSPNSDANFNASVKYALDHGADEILTVSVDQSVPHDVLARWRGLMKSHGADVVGALYCTRQPGHDWLIWDYNEESKKVERCAPVEEFQRVQAIGGGCLFFKAKVFRKIPQPWFTTKVADDGINLIETNEYQFFQKCAAAGIKVYVDNGRVSDHLYEVLLNAQSTGRGGQRMEVYQTTEEQRKIAEAREALEKAQLKVMAGGQLR